MLVLPLELLIQQAAAPDEKRLSGTLRDPAAMFDPDNMRALEGLHPGPLAFLAFDPSVDKPVTDYLLEGSLTVDSGADLLVLFIANETNGVVPLTRTGLGGWIEVEQMERPAHKLVSLLFQSKRVPPLPGIVFFAALQGDADAIFVALTDLSDAAAVRTRLRLLFSYAAKAWDKASGDRAKVISVLGSELLKAEIAADRAGKASMREWWVSAYKFLARHKAAVISVLTLGARVHAGRL